MLDVLAKITGLPAPRVKIPHGLALGVAYASTAFSRLTGREPGIPVEGVKIARHMRFVDCTGAPCGGTKPTATSPKAAPSASLAPPLRLFWPRTLSRRVSTLDQCVSWS